MPWLTEAELATLRAANLPRLDWRDLFTPDSIAEVELSPDHAAELDRYFRTFIMLKPDGGCVACNTVQGGFAAAILGGGFTWGLVHGEGRCGTCGYPARAVHYKVGPIERLTVILQYHPDEVEVAS